MRSCLNGSMHFVDIPKVSIQVVQQVTDDIIVVCDMMFKKIDPQIVADEIVIVFHASLIDAFPPDLAQLLPPAIDEFQYVTLELFQQWVDRHGGHVTIPLGAGEFSDISLMFWVPYINSAGDAKIFHEIRLIGEELYDIVCMLTKQLPK